MRFLKELVNIEDAMQEPEMLLLQKLLELLEDDVQNILTITKQI